MKLKTFYFNPYRQCTYVLSDTQGHALLIDAGMYDEQEQQRLADYLRQEHLTPVACLVTHTHADHICGLEWLCDTYGIPAIIDPKEGPLTMHQAPSTMPAITVLRTPGHKPDCVCYYLEGEQMLFSGDTLFQESIGRTDLEGGNMGEIMHSLRRLMTLPADTTVYPGHGYPTTIEHEQQYNPYI